MNLVDIEVGPVAAIVAMAIATYLTRISGFWLMGHVPLTARLRRMLEALPGAVIAAMVPIVIRSGMPGVLAVGAAVAAMIVIRNELLALAFGLAAAALTRALGL